MNSHIEIINSKLHYIISVGGGGGGGGGEAIIAVQSIT